jgi:predicted Zn-dependent protease
MAQPATNPKIEELRFRLKTDPKSRLFYQLAEELRRAGNFAEAEQVLRSGLAVYPAYLAAWVSLGRTLREQKKDGEAVDALNKAMQLDPGNVVAARLLADAYRNLGDNLEAIKKYKLVHALLPADEELKATIDQLERDLSGGASAGATPALASPPPLQPIEESPFDKTIPPFEESTGDEEPMLAAHDESPFEEPVGTIAEFEVEPPGGIQIEFAPVPAEVPAPVVEEPIVEEPAVEEPPVEAPREEADVFAPAAAEPAPVDDLANTLTMADLYARQGLVHEAQHIYENILARDPGNEDVRAKLEAITSRVNPKIDKLERWLEKVSRKEAGRV